MARDWQEVKMMMEKEIDKIWFDCPLELELAKKGIFPGGAGTYGQAFGNLAFMFADSHCFCCLFFSGPMYKMIQHPDFTLEQCKFVFQSFSHHKTRIMGAGEQGAWLNMPKFWEFTCAIIEAYDSITTKEDFHDLLWSFFNYVDRFNRWTYVMFPWEVGGQLMPALSGDAIPKEFLPLCEEAGIIPGQPLKR